MTYVIDDLIEHGEDGLFPAFYHAEDCPGFCDYSCGGEWCENEQELEAQAAIQRIRFLESQVTFMQELWGAEMIRQERMRQIQEEGFTAEHDSQHQKGELLKAALCYLFLVIDFPAFMNLRMRYWPWAKHWWKPSDDVRNLAKAGALIAAEIDRRLREQIKTKGD